MFLLLLISCLAAPPQDLTVALRALESSSSAERAQAERSLLEFPDLQREEVSLREALERGGPETRRRLARVLGARPDSFQLLVGWISQEGAPAHAAREALGDLYRSFRGGKTDSAPERDALEEPPEDSFRRIWARVPQDGISLLNLVDRLHRRRALKRPLLLAPEEPWESWTIPGSRDGEAWEGFLGPLIAQILEKAPRESARKPSLRSYGAFLWLSCDPTPASEEEAFLRLCRALSAPSADGRRIAALNLGRLGFGPAEKSFAQALRSETGPWLEWSRGLFGGEGVSPWLRERETLQALLGKLPQLTAIHEEIVATLAQLGKKDAAGNDLEPLYAKALERERDEASQSALCRVLAALGSKRALPRLKELARAGSVESLASLLALLDPKEAEAAALETLEAREPSVTALRAAAGAIHSEKACARFGSLVRALLVSPKKPVDCGKRLGNVRELCEAFARLPQQPEAKAAWQSAALSMPEWKKDPDFAAELLLAGLPLPDAAALRSRISAFLRDGALRCPELGARALGRSDDPVARQALASLALRGESAESVRLAALAGLEESLAVIGGPDREKELISLQSSLAPLRAASEKISDRFEAWVQRSLKPRFDRENLFEDF